MNDITLIDDVMNENVIVTINGKELNLTHCVSYTITRNTHPGIEIEFSYVDNEKKEKKIYIPNNCNIQIIKKPNHYD